MTSIGENEIRERFGAGFLKFACPGDEQDAPPWILRFADKDCGEQVFIGEDAEREAWEAWNRYAPSYNCWLFQVASTEAADKLESLSEWVRELAAAIIHIVREHDRNYDRDEMQRLVAERSERALHTKVTDKLESLSEWVRVMAEAGNRLAENLWYGDEASRHTAEDAIKAWRATLTQSPIGGSNG